LNALSLCSSLIVKDAIYTRQLLQSMMATAGTEEASKFISRRPSVQYPRHKRRAHSCITQSEVKLVWTVFISRFYQYCW
jgi:hypothetical protein